MRREKIPAGFSWSCKLLLQDEESSNSLRTSPINMLLKSWTYCSWKSPNLQLCVGEHVADF